MGYIIADIVYAEGERSYPANCFRDDIAVGEFVIVRGGNEGEGGLKTARVVALSYLNWNCRNTVICRRNEAIIDQDSITVPPDVSWVHGLTRPQDLYIALVDRGWTRRIPRSRAYKLAISRDSSDSAAQIFFRANGIDIQILSGAAKLQDSQEQPCSFAPTIGKTVRTSYHKSGINLLKHFLNFAIAFEKSEDLSPYWTKYGDSNREPDALNGRLTD